MRPRILSIELMAIIAMSITTLLVGGCDGSDCAECFDDPGCTDGSCVPRCGVATLKARTTFDDYEAATISFKHATVAEDGRVNNNWDLLFGNDRDPGADLFAVNMVMDDRSFIVDLGDRLTICDVPTVTDPAGYPLGAFGGHDSIPVQLDHLYFIRNVDGETRQLALVQVLEHVADRSVTIRWYRSPVADSFVPPAACAD